MIRLLALAAACTLALATPSFAEDSYPRVGAPLYSSPQNYWDATYQQDIAKLQVVILAAYPGWGSGHGTTLEKTIQALKARNPNLKVLLYVIAENQVSPIPSVWPGLNTKVDAQRWWLYQQWGGSTKVVADDGNGYILNITAYSSKDSSGLRYNQWYAQYLATQLAKTTPSADGFFTDNVFWKPRRDGDWNQDGKIDSAADPTVATWFRQGYAQYLDALHAAMPGKLQIASVADWGLPDASVPEYQGKWNGGFIEGLIGKSYSSERLDGGWQLMMARYRKSMAALGAPKLGLFHMFGDPTDYQAMRYGLASASMDDGYFAFNDRSRGYSGAVHFDEYDAKLGAATSKPQTAAWQAGVYRRDFTNGIILVNPKGNGVRTVTLETDYQKLKGVQDPAANSGKVVRTVTLNDRDGIILLRTTKVATPEAPTDFTVH
jgi:hypothetical protein